MNDKKMHILGEGERTPKSPGEKLSSRLNAQPRRHTPLGNDTAWALKLKEAIDCATRELHVEVHSAAPVLSTTPLDPAHAEYATRPDPSAPMVFELDTKEGRVRATRFPSGKFLFEWM